MPSWWLRRTAKVAESFCFRERRFITARLRWTSPENQELGRSPMHAGFVGLAFRVAAEPSKYECVYIRPTNSRADDQVRRNHSTQYISMPEYEWSRLRKEAPGQYESYVDLVPGEWTKIKIEVSGVKARLFVADSAQPVLVINDLKHGDSEGAVALWIGLGTEGHFANLRLSK